MADIDQYTGLLLHCDGDAGSTAFPDASSRGQVVTAHGDAKVDTTQAKFGTGSLKLDGTGDYLTVPDSPDWDLGAGDFTIDFWARFNVVAIDQAMIGQYKVAGNQRSWYIARDTWNNSVVFGYSIAGNDETWFARSFVPTANTWYHLAVVRIGPVMKLFVNGSQLGADQNIGTVPFFTSTAPLSIGGRDAAAGDMMFNGWLDEIRVSKGIARWTGNFFAPAYPYTGPVPWVLPSEKGLDDFYYARLPFPEAQRKLSEIQPTGTAKLVTVTWHGTRVDPERGSFAVTRLDGELFGWIGWRLAISARSVGGKQRTVHAFMHNAAALTPARPEAAVPELSLPRRIWLALAEPGRDAITAAVQRVPR